MRRWKFFPKPHQTAYGGGYGNGDTGDLYGGDGGVIGQEYGLDQYEGDGWVWYDADGDGAGGGLNTYAALWPGAGGNPVLCEVTT